MNMKGATVYVVAWKYNGGAGFDWYWKESDALKAFETEKANADEFVVEGWTAFRFPYVVQDASGPEAVTSEIDDTLDELMQAAPETYRGKKPAEA